MIVYKEVTAVGYIGLKKTATLSENLASFIPTFTDHVSRGFTKWLPHDITCVLLPKKVFLIWENNSETTLRKLKKYWK